MFSLFIVRTLHNAVSHLKQQNYCTIISANTFPFDFGYEKIIQARHNSAMSAVTIFQLDPLPPTSYFPYPRHHFTISLCIFLQLHIKPNAVFQYILLSLNARTPSSYINFLSGLLTKHTFIDSMRKDTLPHFLNAQ